MLVIGYISVRQNPLIHLGFATVTKNYSYGTSKSVCYLGESDCSGVQMGFCSRYLKEKTCKGKSSSKIRGNH